MNILLAPDKFKGAFSAERVCELMASGIRKALPEANIVSCPIADGGDGFTEVLKLALAGEWVRCEVHDAIGRPVKARYALCGDTAVMEMSEASGIRHIPEDLRDIWRANTYGTGELMRHAIEKQGVRRIIMGIGGSVSNDAGCGMAAALGIQFFDYRGAVLRTTPKELMQCVTIDRSQAIALPEILVACDVDNALLGPHGAVEVYAPQKGASKADLKPLELLLERIVYVADGRETSIVPGAGAAGGLGFGLVQFCGASLISGFDLLAREIELTEKIRACDVVITGEGKLDEQTLRGKGPAGVARIAKQMGKEVAVIAGLVELANTELTDLFDHICELHDPSRSLEQTIEHGEPLLAKKAAELAVVLQRQSEVI